MRSVVLARSWLLAGVVGVLPVGGVFAQPEPAAGEAARAALTRWLDSDLSDAEFLQRAVDAILKAGRPGLSMLGEVASQTRRGDDRRRQRALDSTITHVTLAFLKRETESGMVFEGQYAPLAALQPMVGRLLLRLLLDTPDWYHGGERHLLIAPLRDLYATAPDSDTLQAVREVARDEDFEPQPLRMSLAFLLAQWGDRQLIDQRLAAIDAELQQEGLGDDRRAELRYEIADIHYTLRDYQRAAAIHVEMLRAAEKASARLVPVNYYNAACALSRAGALDAAIDELERGVALMKKGVDPSQMLEAKLFDRDPDLARLRADPRFQRLRQDAFPEKSEGDGGGGRGR